jgi:riboflavin synthase
MFTGIVETIGDIVQIISVKGCKYFTIMPHLPLNDWAIGDSVSINGVCLTVIEFTDRDFKVAAVPETLRLTNLDQLAIHHFVNIERSLKVNARLGGHYIQGHIDGTGEILELSSDQGDALLAKIAIAPQLSKYIVNKAYIGLDGMSITVIHSEPSWFTVTFIPHTQKITITHTYQVGHMINVETDILGKYVEKMLGAYRNVI